MKINTVAIACAALVAAGCSTKKSSVEFVEATPAVPVVRMQTPLPAALPRAVVYKMTGNASAANVPVQVSASGGQIVSFPAPSDVKGQEPIELIDGYLLDRRGIGENARFLRWTYAQYSELKQTPGLAELQAAIIPGARVTDLHVLDMTPSEAAADTAAVNALIRKF